MASVMDSLQLSPFEALADYERRSLAHVAGMPEQIEAPGLWRGIGFRIGQRYLVSGINEVNEILTPPALTIVPGTRGWLLGVANVRGNLVPVIDLKQYLEGERTQATDSSRVLLVRQAGGKLTHGRKPVCAPQLLETTLQLTVCLTQLIGRPLKFATALSLPVRQSAGQRTDGKKNDDLRVSSSHDLRRITREQKNERCVANARAPGGQKPSNPAKVQGCDDYRKIVQPLQNLMR